MVTSLVGFAGPIICNRLASVAGPRGSAGFSSGHKRNRYKKVAAPALHYPSLPWDAARSRVAAHCPTVNNALGSLVSGGVATREARLTHRICREKITWRKSSENWKVQLDIESQGCLRVLWSNWPDVDLLLLPVLLKFNVPPIGQEWRNGGQGMEIWSQIIIGEILGSQKIHFENMFSES